MLDKWSLLSYRGDKILEKRGKGQMNELNNNNMQIGKQARVGRWLYFTYRSV